MGSRVALRSQMPAFSRNQAPLIGEAVIVGRIYSCISHSIVQFSSHAEMAVAFGGNRLLNFFVVIRDTLQGCHLVNDLVDIETLFPYFKIIEKD